MEIKRQKLLIATNNSGKVAEISELLTGAGFELIGLADFLNIPEIEETGTTFDQNAQLKAAGYAVHSGLMSLADDSGLEVDALDGRPGVFSARYGGEELSFAGKMTMLLSEMELSGNATRQARFVCALAVADENGKILFRSEGVCEGSIAPEPRGSGGFGYDPLFVPDGFDNTFGELSADIKAVISHRSRAFKQIIPFLRHFNAL